MPALRLFGRRWLVASDDVAVPAAVLSVFHLGWSIALIVWLSGLDSKRGCANIWHYYVSNGGLLAAFLLSAGLEAAIAWHGLRGAIFETRRRRSVPVLIYCDMASHLLQVAFNVYGTVLLYGEHADCEGGQAFRNPHAEEALIWTTWAVIALLLALLVLTYNIFPDYTDPKSWERRCTCLSLACCCCCCSQKSYQLEEQPLMARLGKLVAGVFGHIDMTPSDMLVAFALAMSLQRMQRKQGWSQEVLQARRRRAGSGGGGSSGVQMSVGSPPGGASPRSFDGLLASSSGADRANGGDNDLERGLLPRQLRTSSKGADGDGAGSLHPPPPKGRAGRGGPRASATAEELGRTSAFAPAHPVGSNLAVGAEKEEEERAGGDISAGGEGGPPGEDAEGGELGAVDAATLREAAHYMKFAFAAYGYMLYIWHKPTTGIMELCCGRQCGLLVGAARARHQKRRLPDVRLVHNLNREATQQAAGLADNDLLFVRYEAEVPSVLPYFIALDHSRRAVVLAIRGSLSLSDVVRDLLFEPVSLDEWLAPGRQWHQPPPDIRLADKDTKYAGHAGILEAARATLMDLQKHDVLRRALAGEVGGARRGPAPSGSGKAKGGSGKANGDTADAAAGGSSSSSASNYRLVVTGHSLGAGCAFFVALALRQFCPDLRCWAFSPPGGLATDELSAQAGEWCTSVVNGKEWIPRLSVRTFDRMRDEVVYAAVRCKRNKWTLAASSLRGKLHNRWREGELFYRPDEIPAEPAEFLHEYELSVEQRANRQQGFWEIMARFTPPGRCFHLRPTGVEADSSRSHTPQRQYRAVWVDGNAIIDEGIILSGRMMADHMPDYLLATLRSMAQAVRQDHATATISDSAGHDMAEDMLEGDHGSGELHSAASGQTASSSGRRSGSGASRRAPSASGRQPA